MPVMKLRKATFTLALCTAVAVFGTARAQDSGSAAGQPVPGAMAGSDAVSSTLSAKNAADDRLPTAAYTFKQLTQDQQRAIYQGITGKSVSADPPAAPAAEISTKLPPSVALSAIPGEVTAQIPQTSGYAYAMAGDKLLLVSPADRVVVGAITP